MRISKRIFILVVCCLAALSPETYPQGKGEKIDALLSQAHEYGRFSGAVLVAENGAVIFKKGYGMANREWDIPNTPDTKFRIGSVTKQFTAMIVMQLVQRGALKLDGHITDYVPDYPRKTGDVVTIHHLLTHTSGIPNYTDFPRFQQDMSREPIEPREFVRYFADSTLRFEPGSRFEYSNSGYFLLGVIIERVTGKPFEQVLSEQILAPLHMTGTGYDHSNAVLNKRASGYQRGIDGYENASYLDMTVPFSAGALYSTVEDMSLWDQALYTEKLLPESSRNTMFAPRIPALGGSYAYGWVIRKASIGSTSDSVEVMEHGGTINGFQALITRLPNQKHVIVLFSNTGGAPLGFLCQSIRGILFGKPYALPKKSVAETIFSTIMEKGLPSALTLYQEISARPDSYVLEEGEMNIVGYRLLRLKKVKEAIRVFSLNVEAFPKSFNVYDSLGEAYMIDGDTELAIKNYQVSIELNPGNMNGIEALKKLRKTER